MIMMQQNPDNQPPAVKPDEVAYVYVAALRRYVRDTSKCLACHSSGRCIRGLQGDGLCETSHSSPKGGSKNG